MKVSLDELVTLSSYIQGEMYVGGHRLFIIAKDYQKDSISTGNDKTSVILLAPGKKELRQDSKSMSFVVFLSLLLYGSSYCLLVSCHHAHHILLLVLCLSDTCGSLYNALEVFKLEGVNMISLHSLYGRINGRTQSLNIHVYIGDAHLLTWVSCRLSWYLSYCWM